MRSPAAARGHRAILLVGDEPYYRRFGFTRSAVEDLRLPGPVDRDRFLGLELEEGALLNASGVLTATGHVIDAAAAPVAVRSLAPEARLIRADLCGEEYLLRVLYGEKVQRSKRQVPPTHQYDLVIPAEPKRSPLSLRERVASAKRMPGEGNGTSQIHHQRCPSP